MLDERKIGLGLGYLSVEGRGAAMVISAAASKVERTSQKQFTFKAQLCDSAEELQKSFSAAMSVSASAHGADLGANGSLSKATDASHFDAYYMMELEFREECASLDSLRDILEILDPSIRVELESLDTVEKWEEFYRTKGSHIINSVIYGRKLIIIVSLNHKVQNEQLRRMLEAKAGFPGTGDAKASLESSLKALAKENISSVQIHSIGDSNPDYLGDIDKLAALKKKIDNFVNPAPKQKAEPEISAKLSDAMPRLCTSETQGGVVIAYSTCPYIDFLNKQTPKCKQIEIAYEKMLQATNRSSRYLEELARCQGRLDTLLRSVDFYLTGHDGAFTLKHPTEVAAGHLRKFLGKHTNTLRGIAREVVAETTGLTEEGRRRRTLRLEAKECLGLLDDFTATLATCGIKEARILLATRLSLIEKFETTLNEQEGRTLGLKQRFIDVLTVFEETEAQKKTYLPSLKLLRARFDNEVALYLEKRTDLVNELMGIYNNLIVVLRRSKEVAVISEEEKSLFAKLLGSLKQAVGTEEDQDPWLSELAEFYRDMDTDFKPIFEEDTDAPTGSKIIISRNLLEEYLLPLEELLTDGNQLMEGFQPERAAHASEDIINSVSRELDTTISFLVNRYSSHFGRFKKITEEFIALRARIDTEPREAGDRLASILEACELKPNETALLKKITTEYIKKIEKEESSEAWWQARWAQILEVSQDLDSIVSNQKPEKLSEDISKILTAIDFKREAYLVGNLPVKRGWGFHNSEFSGNHYEKIKVPSSLRFLRFKLTGDLAEDKISQLAVPFNLVSKRKIHLTEHKSAHRTLYKSIYTLDPIYPAEPNMRGVAKLLGSKTKTASVLRGEELMHRRNETAMKVRIQGLSSKDIAQNTRKMSVLMYAQLGKELDSLALSKDAPKGVADYGVRVRAVDTMEASMLQRQLRSEVSVSHQMRSSERQSLRVVRARQLLLRPRPSFFVDQPTTPLQRVASIEIEERSIIQQTSPLQSPLSSVVSVEEPSVLSRDDTQSITPHS